MLAGLLRERWRFLQHPGYQAHPRFAFGRKAEGGMRKWLRDMGLWKTAPGVMGGLPGPFCYGWAIGRLLRRHLDSRMAYEVADG